MNLPDNIEPRDIKSIRGLFKNLDPNDSPDDIALELRNARLNTNGLLTKDYGTINLLPSYPTTEIVADTSFDIRSHEVLKDASVNVAHSVFYGPDSNGKSRIYVNKSVTGTPDFDWLNAIVHLIDTGAAFVPTYSGTTKLSLLRVNVDDIDLGGASGPAPATVAENAYAGWLAVKNLQAALVVSNTAGVSSGTIDVYVLGDVATLGWSDSTVVLYRNPYTYLLDYLSSNMLNGATPLVRWHAMDALKKLILLHTATNGTRRIPLQINKRDSFVWFKNTVPNPDLILATFPAGFYLDIYGANADFQEAGTVAAALVPASGTITKTIEAANASYSFLKIRVSVADTTGITRDAAVLTHFYGYVTLIYRGGESDPVYRFYTGSAVATNSPTATLDFDFNPALMDREIVGIRIYGRAYTAAEIEGNTAAILQLDTEAILVKEYNFSDDTTAWSVVTGSDHCVRYTQALTVAQDTWQREPLKVHNTTITFANEAVVGEGVPTITDLLNHGIDRNRDWHTPRFITSSTNNKGDIIITDESDKKLRFTGYDGFGTHAEDIYPDSSVDRGGNRLIGSLIGQGKIMGLVPSGNSVLILRKNSTERYNLSVGGSDILEPDCTSEDSVVVTPHGTAWAGSAGIWWAPRNGATPYLINVPLQNEHDGRLTLANGTPFVTDAYRSTIKGGYNALFSEIWMQYKMNVEGGGTEYVCKRYFLPEASYEKGQWVERKLGAAIEAIHFSQTGDNRLCIVLADSILVYPNIEEGYNYLDGVEIDTSGDAVASTGEGFEMSVTLALGSIANAAAGSLLHGIKFNHVGKTLSGLGKYLVEIFLNNRTVAATSVYQRIDQPPTYITIPRIGAVKLFKVRISIPSATRADTTKLDISSVTHYSKRGETVHA